MSENPYKQLALRLDALPNGYPATKEGEELRILELLRHRLDVDRLAAAGIERGARARHTTL